MTHLTAQAIMGLRATLRILLNALDAEEERDSARPRQYIVEYQATDGRIFTIHVEATYWQDAARKAYDRNAFGLASSAHKVVRIIDDGGRIVWQRMEEIGL